MDLEENEKFSFLDVLLDVLVTKKTHSILGYSVQKTDTYTLDKHLLSYIIT